MTSRDGSGDTGGADSPDPSLHALSEDKYGEVVLERLPEEVELPVFQELEEVKLKPSIFGLMCNELVVAPCIDLFASHRHHQLPCYYSAYDDDSEALWQNAFAYLCDPGDEELMKTMGACTPRTPGDIAVIYQSKVA